MSGLKRLIHEIHRRSLWQVLAIYLVGAWIGYEVVQALTEGLQLSAWFPALALVLFIIGLPLVLATAFVQESPAFRPRSGESSFARRELAGPLTSVWPCWAHSASVRMTPALQRGAGKTHNR